jgi:hypothetical protein
VGVRLEGTRVLGVSLEVRFVPCTVGAEVRPAVPVLARSEGRVAVRAWGIPTRGVLGRVVDVVPVFLPGVATPEVPLSPRVGVATLDVPVSPRPVVAPLAVPG